MVAVTVDCNPGAWKVVRLIIFEASQSVDVQHARIYVDDIFIGNVSARMPVLHLKMQLSCRALSIQTPGPKWPGSARDKCLKYCWIGVEKQVERDWSG